MDILVKTPAEITQALEKGDFFSHDIVFQSWPSHYIIR
jgi:hypothetical protein